VLTPSETTKRPIAVAGDAVAPACILLALGDSRQAHVRARLLTDLGHAVVVSTSLAGLIRAIDASPPALVVLSTRLSLTDSPLDGLTRLARTAAPPPVVLQAPGLSTDLVLSALRSGVADVCDEKCSDVEFLTSVGRGLARHAARTGSHAVPSAVSSLLAGRSRVIREVREYATRLAATDTTVLVTGETGVGKELVARLLHEGSPRASRPFVSLNCAAIPESLLESELFGHERGAFTGATSARPGQFQRADGGTFLFDEVGDMGLLAQAKVLRAIELRQVTPLGGSRAVPVDVRLVAATNQDLDQMTAEGRFRADLYYRLNVARLDLPPLRDRLEDLDDLLDAFLREFAVRFGRAITRFAPAALDVLRQYPWPGNVRELRNLVELTYINVAGDVVNADDLPARIRAASVTRPPAEDERGRLVSALTATGWNKSRAARTLHWSRMTLYRKLAKYGVADREP
jgi:two-component system response regulator HydG/two-component system response regulator AtoC